MEQQDRRYREAALIAVGVNSPLYVLSTRSATPVGGLTCRLVFTTMTRLVMPLGFLVTQPSMVGSDVSFLLGFSCCLSCFARRFCPPLLFCLQADTSLGRRLSPCTVWCCTRHSAAGPLHASHSSACMLGLSCPAGLLFLYIHCMMKACLLLSGVLLCKCQAVASE